MAARALLPWLFVFVAALALWAANMLSTAPTSNTQPRLRLKLWRARFKDSTNHAHNKVLRPASRCEALEANISYPEDLYAGWGGGDRTMSPEPGTYVSSGCWNRSDATRGRLLSAGGCVHQFIKETIARDVFFLGGMTFRPPFRRPSHRVMLPPVPTRGESSRILRHINMLHKRRCGVSTPIALFWGLLAGFGQELNGLILAFHAAVSLNRTLVYAPLGAPRSNTTQLLTQLVRYGRKDIVRPSTCEVAIRKRRLRPLDLLDVVIIPRTPATVDYPLPVWARDKTKPLDMYTWFRLLSRYLVRPSARLTAGAVASMGAGVDLRPHQRHNKKVDHPIDRIGADMRRHLRLDHPYAAVHIRAGDLCSAEPCNREPNPRPRHCVVDINAYLNVLMQRDFLKGSVYVATDSWRAAESVKQYMRSKQRRFRIHLAPIQRHKYETRNGVFIEHKPGLDVDRTLEDFLIDVALLSGAQLLLGSFYSNLPRIATALGTQTSLVSLDTLWCFEAGCPLYSPRHTWSHQALVRSMGIEDGTVTYLSLLRRGVNSVTRRHPRRSLLDDTVQWTKKHNVSVWDIAQAFHIHSAHANSPIGRIFFTPAPWVEYTISDRAGRLNSTIKSFLTAISLSKQQQKAFYISLRGRRRLTIEQIIAALLNV